MIEQTNLKEQLQDVILEISSNLDPCVEDTMTVDIYTYGNVRHWLEVLTKIRDEMKG